MLKHLTVVGLDQVSLRLLSIQQGAQPCDLAAHGFLHTQEVRLEVLVLIRQRLGQRLGRGYETLRSQSERRLVLGGVYIRSKTQNIQQGAPYGMLLSLTGIEGGLSGGIVSPFLVEPFEKVGLSAFHIEHCKQQL